MRIGVPRRRLRRNGTAWARGADLRFGKAVREAAAELEGSVVPLERRPANGLYDGHAEVIHVAPDVSGEDIVKVQRARGMRPKPRAPRRDKGGARSKGVPRRCRYCGRAHKRAEQCWT